MKSSSSSSSSSTVFRPPDSSLTCNRPSYLQYLPRSPNGASRPGFPVKFHNCSGQRTSPNRANFVIDLVLDHRGVAKCSVEVLMAKCNSKPDNFIVPQGGPVVAFLFFKQWVSALEAMVRFWELRLDGLHDFTPILKPRINLPSDADELHDRLRNLFAERIQRLMDGEKVQDWQKKRDLVKVQIDRISHSLRKPLGIATQFELREKRKGLIVEKDSIMRNTEEFKSAMRYILDYVEGKKLELPDSEDVGVFKFDETISWNRIHSLILRECRRLEDSLPMYSCRREILRQIYSQQVMVLIGETGSGKSTQLVQFLADSGLSSSKSIVCTQPRKISAISLAHRVREESRGCYDDDCISCYPSFSSAQQFKSKIIYMTDHCLLQHYMNDKKLSDVSCIIIDEAHERSLNTDLLFALLKSLLMERVDLHLIIMSATANADQLSKYFFGCGIFHVPGRNFPVDIRYVPSLDEGSSGPCIVASYVTDVVRMASEIHWKEKGGTILAFLTSQMEVEWACENFHAPGTVPLAFHGKQSFDEQFRVFQDHPGKRKVIFATNLAETSLTIPGVKYVIDPGWVKDSKFEPRNGMNILKVCRTSQSSANQRAGRAGRTEPGRCYRLYSQSDFELMSPNHEPEIRKVHLGVAILRILALGVKNVDDFDFVDAPSAEAVDMAIRNLVQLGAITLNSNVYELTNEGRNLVKLGIEPRLGKLILGCFNCRVRREGVVLAVLMTNASSIFCRVGKVEDKLKSDCQKVQFCHPDGDLFTLLSVYKQYEALPRERKNQWCWENSINAKTMRRCQDAILELERCLKQELNIIIPSYWLWSSLKPTDHDRNLKKCILASLSENVAMFTGYDRLGYEVAMTGRHVQLHPSCSLLIFSEKPKWVVFGEILSISNEYLVCVTAIDVDALSTISPPPLFDISLMEKHRLEVRTLSGFGKTLLKRVCGKSNSNLISLTSHVRKVFSDDCMGIEVNINQNEVLLFSRSENMDAVYHFVNDILEYERKYLWNECMEKCLYHGNGGSPPVALLGSGAKIRHLELEKRYLTVDVFRSNVDSIDDKELFMSLEKSVSGTICTIQKVPCSGQDDDDKERGHRITFLTPDAAEKALKLDGGFFCGSLVKIIPMRITAGCDNKLFSFPPVKAKVFWPRRLSKGFAVVKCNSYDVSFLVNDFSNLLIGERFLRCEPSIKYNDCVTLSGIDKELSEADIFNILRSATDRKILDLFLVRENPVNNPPVNACEEALLKEISAFMPKSHPHVKCCYVQVFQPQPKDFYMRAAITFDGRLHLEAAKALEYLEGKSLPICFPWQKIKCQQLFHSTLSCTIPIFRVIKCQLNSLLESLKKIDGAECTLSQNINGSYRVKLSANATKTVAELRRPVEALLRGKIIDHASVTPTVLQHLTSRDGFDLINLLQRENEVYILFDRQRLSLRIFGASENVAAAERKLIQSLQTLHERKQLEIHLRGKSRPPNLLKTVVEKFGPDLNGLKQKFPEAGFTLNTRHHILSVHGSKDLKQEVETIIYELEKTSGGLAERPDDADACSICLCDIEDDRFELEACGHHFCRQCLVEQFESAIKNHGSFPVCCAKQTCQSPILLTDMRYLLSNEKLEELFRASLGAFVAGDSAYRFCPSPDCPSVYRVASPDTCGEPFMCGACFSETCTRCHLEYHPFLSCEQYRVFKEDPDSSLDEWRKGKENVKNCPACGYTIEKIEGCNHIECKCGRHICWVCLDYFGSSDECYGHLRSIHMAFV
ncbi:ATP-dependent RNA helicase DEAH12, chloroplastic-like [Cucurbita moschata]|uniref:RNA helicase n=1 Tax=Cucurbita moschata TaxID=3662 RepID=A0A6J1FR66_CUCMO|nr:ATP-dependent RNA helicase DEAH12, chloroplastic-like [Cucurbita moschata]